MIDESRFRAEFWVTLVWRLLTRIVGVLLLVYIAYRLRFVAVTITMAAILALAVNPLVERCADWIPLRRTKRGVRRLISALFVFIGLIALFVLANMVLFHPFKLELTRVTEQIPVYARDVDNYVHRASVWYRALPTDIQDTLRKQDFSSFARTIGAAVGNLMHSTLMWLSRFVELILIPVLAFYFVMDHRTLKREFVFLVPKRRIRESLMLLHEVGEITQSYVVGQLILCLIAGIVVWLMLTAFGVHYALTLGVLAGITRAIPVVGPIIGGIPIVVLAALQSWQTGVEVLIFFSVLHLVESKFIMPKLIGHRMHLHAAVVIIALLVGGEFFGLLGMFLAAPVAAVIKVLVNFYIVDPGAARRFPKGPRGPVGSIVEPAQVGKESLV